MQDPLKTCGSKANFSLNESNSFLSSKKIFVDKGYFAVFKTLQLLDSLEIDYYETCRISGWDAPFSTSDGIRIMADWYKNNYLKQNN